MMKKKLTAIVLVFVLLLSSVPAFAATGKVSTRNVTNLYDAYNSTKKTWNELKTSKHRLMDKFVIYCLQHKKTVPNSAPYNLTDLMDYYSNKVKTGLIIILQNGYPWVTNGLSAQQAEYATANAIRFWLSECGDDQFYNMTDLGDFTNSKLRSLAASGTITKKIRVRNAAYIPALQFSVELLIKARSQVLMDHDISLSASSISAPRSGSYFTGSTTVTTENLRGGYTLDQSGLPGGSTVSGYTGKSGDNLTVSIPASASTANKTYTIALTGRDDRVRINMQVFHHNTDLSYQRVLAARLGEDWYQDVVTKTITVTTGAYETKKPDLIVSSLTTDKASYFDDEMITVTAVIKNQDNLSTGSFNVSMSASEVGGTKSVSSLAAGATTTLSWNFYAPPPGTLSITVTADSGNAVSERNENNNEKTIRVSIKERPAYPDLTVQSLTANKSTYNAGETVTVTAVIVNQGEKDAGAFTASFGLPDANHPKSVGSLASGGKITLTWTFTAPALTETAEWGFSVWADSQKVVSESNEDNNFATSSVTVIGVKPDLTVTAVTPQKSEYRANTTVTVQTTIANQGNADAGSFVVKFTPSGMSSQTQTVSGLKPGMGATLTWTFTAPVLTKTTPWGFTVQADSTNAVSESNENNNTGSGSVTIIGENPDLQVTAVKVDATKYSPGETVTIAVTVKNNGIIDCPASALKLSGSGISTQNKAVSAISAGASRTISFTFTAPNIEGDVTYSITATADPDNVIAESNETNNSGKGSFRVYNPLADLTVTEIRSDKNVYTEGDTGTVTVTVKNQGGKSITNGKLKLQLGDFFSEVKQTGPVFAGGSIQVTFTFVAPETTAQRTITATATADPTNEISESNENNNTLTSSLAVKPLLPDLAIIGTNATNWYAGKDIVVTATVQNYTEADVPNLTVRLMIGSQRYEETIPIAGNGSNLAVFRITLPTQLGPTALRFIADPYNTLQEEDKGNNDYDKTIQIVAVPAGDVLDPDSLALEEQYRNHGLSSLPDTENSDYHIWQEVRLECGSYVTKTFWAQLQTVFQVAPDPRIAYPDAPTRMESGFGVQAGLQTILTTNYDHPEKLVGVQMAWTFAPESGYGQIFGWETVFDGMEPFSGTAGGKNTVWQYKVNPWSESGSRLHYTPLWFPDGQYTLLSQAFYAWSPAGQMYWYDAASVDILGDMYDRVTAVQGRYLSEHPDGKDVTEWLRTAYSKTGGNALFVTRSGSNVSVQLSWEDAAARIRQLISEDHFFTDEEQDQFEDIDFEAVREALNSPEAQERTVQMIAQAEAIASRETPESEETEIAEPSERFEIIELAHGTTPTYAVWDNLMNGYFVDDFGNSEVFESEWQAEAYLEEVLQSLSEQEVYEEVEKIPPVQSVEEEVTLREITIVLNDPDNLYGTRVPNEEELTDGESIEKHPSEHGTTVPQSEPLTDGTAVPRSETATSGTAVPDHHSFGGTKNPHAGNYRIHDDHLGEGGERTKADRNIEAIRTLKMLEAEKRPATADEQETLAQYVGWGGISQIFDESNTRWKERRETLKELLTDSEYASARASTLNAHYTSPTVIRAIYQGLENMGFRQGNVLEPSCGVGNFIGMMPETMRESKVYGVELDSVSGRIAQKLYPESQIAVQGFEHSQLPDSFFDAAVGNVPFGAYSLPDPKYDKHHFRIHDYFFGKSLDKLRPGGILAFVTSKGTMDKLDSSVRRYISQRAELLGAIRLPNTAFKLNAGTEVTSDILFLQKRERIVDVEPDWIHVGKNDDGIPVNQYFLDHPEMVLGRMVMGKSMYGNEQETSCEPIPGAVLSEQLSAVIPNIRGRYEAVEIDEPTQDESRIAADPMVSNFTFAVQDGKVYYRRDHWMERCDLSVNDNQRVRGMIALRTLTRELIQAQLDGANDATVGELQMELNSRYDAFTAQFGLLSDRKNASVFREDDGYYLLTSLEILDDERKLERKADIFTRRTIAANMTIDHVETAPEALAVSMAERAYVDLDYMSDLTGMDKDRLIGDLQGLIYQDPKGNPDAYSGWETADEYLSGDVRQKLKVAEMYAQNDPRFAANVEALKAVQPKDLEPHEIDVRIGATWIPPSDISDFIHDTLHTPGYMRYKIRAEFAAATGVWHIDSKSSDYNNPLASTKYGTNRRSAYQLIEESLNLRDAKVFDVVQDEYGNEKRVLNQKETILAQQKQTLIREAFRDWIWQKPERRERLCRMYNDTFNSIRPREYDGAHLRFPGMNPDLELRPHQKNAVARILYGGNTLLAHTVGAGKTAVMVASIMEKVRIGLGHKALIAVPNHLTEQTAAEFLRFFPSAKVLVATKRDFEKQNRKRFMGRVATGDYDVIIMGHSQFEKVPISKERQIRMLEEQIQELMDGIAELKHSRNEQFSVKQMEASRKSLEARLKRLNSDEDKDAVITFEELGVDMLYVDEAHGFKNLAVVTKMRNVAGINTQEAKKSSDMYMKCRYISELTDNRGVVFATGTPISNSMTELYTMQRYLQHTELERRGLSHFDSWAANFGETVTAIELAPEGTGYRLKTRFSKFFNLPELMTMFKQTADIQTPDMLNLPVPALKGGKTLNIRTEASEYQRRMVQMLGERAEAVRRGNIDPKVDNMLKITNDGRLLALDARLIDPTLPDDPDSKVNACVREVLRIHRDGESEKHTQLIFSDLSTPRLEKTDGSFDDVYHDIRRKLVANGVPEHEIAFIHDADTDVKKDELFAKVRKGAVRILIGSTAKMGAGTNVQTKLKALHHLDCPWRPSDLQQRDGRILRQGNTNPEVEVIRYITQDTFDAYSYQLVENKQKFVAQIFTSKSPVRGAEDLDEMALSYAEVKALAAGNPAIREKMDLDVQVSRLKLLKSNWQSERYRLEKRVNVELPGEIMRLEHRIGQIQKDIELYNTHQPPAEDGFLITLMDQPFDKRAEAGERLMKALTIVHIGESMKLGEYCGFTLRLIRPDMLGTPKVEIQGEGSYTVELGESPLGNIQRIENLAAGLKQVLETDQSRLENTKTQLESARREMNAEWPQEKELQEKSARLAELNVQLDVGGGDAGVAALDMTEDAPTEPPEKNTRKRESAR